MGFLRILCVSICLLATHNMVAQSEDCQYERNSLCILLIKHYDQVHEDIVTDVFQDVPFPERFNNHALGVRSIAFQGIQGEMSEKIKSFCQQENVGQKMVAKWFNRDKNSGSFNMELIKERGLYNATMTQQNVARSTMRDLRLLEDAGENLIKNTFLIVNDVEYYDLHKKLTPIAKKRITDSKGLNTYKYYSKTRNYGSTRGFIVQITTYLFRLKWSEDEAGIFYNSYYTENGLKDRDKVLSFKQDAGRWGMEYVGKNFCFEEGLERDKLRDPKSLLIKLSTRALDKNLALLQHSYPDFCIKAPLVSAEPLKAYVGQKEDIKPESKFEVLDRVIDKEGRLTYKRVGIIKPKDGRAIWDNRYMADDEDADAKMGYTEFERVSGGPFSTGMLIRETK